MMSSNLYILALLAALPLILATYISSLPSKPPDDDADIVKVLVKEVQELKLVVKLQGAQVTDLQNTVNKQEKHITELEKRLDSIETPESHRAPSERHTNDSSIQTTGQIQVAATVEEHSEPRAKGKIREADVPFRGESDYMAGRELSRGVRDVPQVAFSAYLDHALLNLTVGQAVQCNVAQLNDGNGYNVHTGVFTAPTSGVYFFIFFIHDYDVAETEVHLVVDDDHKAAAIVWEPQAKGDDMGGNSVILFLSAGQNVWLQTHTYPNAGLRSGEVERLVTFSGFRLY